MRVKSKAKAGTNCKHWKKVVVAGSRTKRKSKTAVEKASHGCSNAGTNPKKPLKALEGLIKPFCTPRTVLIQHSGLRQDRRNRPSNCWLGKGEGEANAEKV